MRKIFTVLVLLSICFWALLIAKSFAEDLDELIEDDPIAALEKLEEQLQEFKAELEAAGVSAECRVEGVGLELRPILTPPTTPRRNFLTRPLSNIAEYKKPVSTQPSKFGQFFDPLIRLFRSL